MFNLSNTPARTMTQAQIEAEYGMLEDTLHDLTYGNQHDAIDWQLVNTIRARLEVLDDAPTTPEAKIVACQFASASRSVDLIASPVGDILSIHHRTQGTRGTDYLTIDLDSPEIGYGQVQLSHTADVHAIRAAVRSLVEDYKEYLAYASEGIVGCPD